VLETRYGSLKVSKEAVIIKINCTKSGCIVTHNPDDELKYKSYLRVFKGVTRAAQSVFYRERFDTRTNTITQLWNNLNQISSLGKTRTRTNISKLTYNDKDLTESSDICNALNNYFCSVGPSLVQSLKPAGQFDFKRYCPIAPIPVRIVCFVALLLLMKLLE